MNLVHCFEIPLIFMNKMTKDNTEATELASMIGKSCFIIPYTNQQRIPVNIIEYIPSEISSVERVFQV